MERWAGSKDAPFSKSETAWENDREAIRALAYPLSLCPTAKVGGRRRQFTLEIPI